ncbi:hypothetical protein M407DRAFT_26470 [Tulasnella calospora MUT 4182]|uniref:CFEM domain-containing protein n=1 Tax=Tulasnella calospora MUT 4182 TaxID=1051891 RepID=A0A0C3QFN2_9AGAM|nr:hypothetical protein M407DRAFT_26470 [Tulasnella calospora MUT 4182]
MRFSITTVLFAASLASADTIAKRQTASDLPPCAQTCYANTSPAPCDTTDITCQCLNPNFLTSFTQCVVSSCSAEDAQATQAVARAICKTGVDLTSSNPLPACAQPCDANTTSATCPAPADANTVPDVACYCKDTTYIQTIDTCFKSSCTGQDLTTAETVGKALCKAYGVDISSAVPAA